MKDQRKGKGPNLDEALKAAAKEVDADALGEYRVELTVIVGNPTIKEYHVTIIPV